MTFVRQQNTLGKGV